MRYRSVAIGILCCVGWVSFAEAQQASNVVPPESIWKGRSHVVFTITGEEVAGRLVAFEPGEARLLVKGQLQTWHLNEIAQVDRKGDSLKNGATIGALVLGGWCAFVCGQGLDDSGDLPSVVIINAGLGALIGAAIDAGKQSRVTIYRRAIPPGNPQARRLFLYRLSF